MGMVHQKNHVILSAGTGWSQRTEDDKRAGFSKQNKVWADSPEL